MADISNMFSKFGVVFKPNQIIFCEYEPGKDFYLIQSGKVRVTKIVEEREKTIAYFEAGDMFGEMALLEEAPRSATAIAETETKMLKFDKTSFDFLLKNNPQIALKLLKVFSKRIFEAKRRLQVLRLPDDDMKVIDSLLMLSEKAGYGQDRMDPVSLNTNPGEIAQWCGLSSDEVANILTHYHQKLNKIVVNDDTIILKNPKELYRMIFAKKNQRH